MPFWFEQWKSSRRVRTLNDKMNPATSSFRVGEKVAVFCTQIQLTDQGEASYHKLATLIKKAMKS